MWLAFPGVAAIVEVEWTGRRCFGRARVRDVDLPFEKLEFGYLSLGGYDGAL